MFNAQAIRTWLRQKGIDRCGACGSDDLRVSKDRYAIICVDEATGAPDARRGSRVVRMRCGNCANLMLLHARQMGLE
jgi:hypothetical protein